MNSIVRKIALTLALLMAQQIQAQSLVLLGGLGMTPDASLDLTYQVVKELDEKEKVVAAWSGDKLLYTVSSERLPAGWTDPDAYFKGLMRDLRSTGRTVTTGRSGTYTTGSPLTGHYLEYRLKDAAQPEEATMVAHFLTDGSTAFLSIATLIDAGAADQMLNDTQRLFKTASVVTGAAVPPAEPRAEAPYVGTWTMTSAAADDKTTTAVIALREDGSFSVDARMRGKPVFRGVGAWWVAGNRLVWNYTGSTPELPVAQRKEEDDIVRLEGNRLRLRAVPSGQERELVRE